MKRLTSIILALAVTISCLCYSPVRNTAAKTKTINDYLTTSFDVYRVYQVKGQNEFDDLYKEKELFPAVEEPYMVEGSAGMAGVTNTITAKTDGCLLLKVEKGDFLRGLNIVDISV